MKHGGQPSFYGKMQLVDRLHALLDDEPLRTDVDAAHHPPLVVKVAEHHEDAAALFAERVLDRHLDVVERDVCRAGGGRIRRLDRLRGDAFAALDENDRETVLRETVSTNRTSWRAGHGLTSVLHPTVKLADKDDAADQHTVRMEATGNNDHSLVREPAKHHVSPVSSQRIVHNGTTRLTFRS